jgi:SAM-dependent methyltransferase
MSDTAVYYDRLSRWTAVARFFGYGGGRDGLTVHRALADPRAEGRPTPTRLHELLLETLPPLAAPRVLDAGCGLGGTMIELAARLGGTCTGVTLSEQQAAIGRRAIASAGLDTSITIRVGSYDAPPVGPFDLIVAIESLAHSPDPRVSIDALSACLSTGGYLAVVDDMPEPSASAADDLTTFKSGWRLPVLWTAVEYRAAFRCTGLELIADRDLTAQLRPRTVGRIRQLELLNRGVRHLVASEGGRAMLDSYHGGLALERLYRRGRMRYRLLLARRGPAS